MAEFFTHLLRGRVIDAAQHFLRRPTSVNGLVRAWRRGPDGRLIAEWHCEADRRRERDAA